MPGPELKIGHVIPGSPADESGLEVGDILTHVNGEAVVGKDYGLVQQALLATGEVRLSLRREDRKFDKALTLRRLI